MADRATAKAQVAELHERDDAVLALGEPREREVDRRHATFGPHDGLNAGLDAHRPMVTGTR
jgi:hypothetical protein